MLYGRRCIAPGSRGRIARAALPIGQYRFRQFRREFSPQFQQSPPSSRRTGNSPGANTASIWAAWRGLFCSRLGLFLFFAFAKADNIFWDSQYSPEPFRNRSQGRRRNRRFIDMAGNMETRYQERILDRRDAASKERNVTHDCIDARERAHRDNEIELVVGHIDF